MTSLAWQLTSLVGAIVLAAVGGELFLKGVLGLAQATRLPKALVATTIAAFATSSPELVVSTTAALAGKPEIGLGDALGSNIVNIALILGLALLLRPLSITRRELGYTFGLALLVPMLTMWLAHDGTLSQGEGILLLAVFLIWLGATVRTGFRARSTEPAAPGSNFPKSILFGVCGLAALIVAGRLFIVGATGLASVIGADVFLVGVFVIAIGTSLPELVTVLFSRLRGHDDIGIGTLLGSNLFNGLAIVGLTASIHPIAVPFAEIAVVLVMGGLTLLLIIPARSDVIGRARGGLLLGAYGFFAAASIVANDWN